MQNLSELHQQYDRSIPAHLKQQALYGVEDSQQTPAQLITIIENNKRTARAHVDAILAFRAARPALGTLERAKATISIRRRCVALKRCLRSNREINLKLAALESRSIRQAAA